MLLNNTVHFLIDITSTLFIFVAILAMLLEWCAVSGRHPFVALIHQMTEPFVQPVLKFMPGLKRWQAFFIMALAISFFSSLLLIALAPAAYHWGHAQFWLYMLGLSLLNIFKIKLHVVAAALVVQVILSWIHPWNPLMPILNSITRPLLWPFRRLVWNNIDFSPFLLFLLLQLILVLFIPYIERLFILGLPFAF
jgi:YggT family protein